MTETALSPEHNKQDDGFSVSALQQAWLVEIGMDRRILARYGKVAVADPHVPVEVASGTRDVSAASQTVTTTAPTLPPTQPAGADQGAAVLKQVRAQLEPQSRRVKPSGLTRIGTSLAQADGSASNRADLPADLNALAAHAQACRACELHTHRDQLVFGAGDIDQPDWLIIGEAPGQADDRTGRPFQGKAGQLLHAMLVAAGVHSSSFVLGPSPSVIPPWSQPARVYFANLIKCRPLGNRSPALPEITSCFPYLQQQIELLQPRRILVLGRLTAQALLQVDADVEELRGQVHRLSTSSGAQIPLVVTWHPAGLLMHPQNKAQAWQDLMLAKRAVG